MSSPEQPKPMPTMDYEELKRELSSRSISQLPGLLQHIARLCSIKPVFKNKEAMLGFAGRAWDMGGVGDAELRSNQAQYEPPGVKFYSQSMNREMKLVKDAGRPWDGWLVWKHPDGHWVSLRLATKADLAELDNAIVSARHA